MITLPMKQQEQTSHDDMETSETAAVRLSAPRSGLNIQGLLAPFVMPFPMTVMPEGEKNYRTRGAAEGLTIPSFQNNHIFLCEVTIELTRKICLLRLH